MGNIRYFISVFILISGCGPTPNCKRLPQIIVHDSYGANWYIITYVKPDLVECASIMRGETWKDWGIFINQNEVNKDRGYSLEEAESLVEKKYCALTKDG